MTSILFALAVTALVVYGLERNHRRQPRLGSRMAGSTDVEDRDVTRLAGDLRAAAAHRPTARTTHRPAVTPARSVSPAC
ncbi:hypothetical protein LZG04_02495 [Saccharothrix sp. S26]|uniref:hypothetical protein n=1 Tax=Saccharothrix sp. S26 TaxID=2907215 RepID=UPI001F3D6B88|nr:hypothetical protein [Saccharothrix sp. S26]MCE6993681.1 hypothetical protein [Saccharothrix sp. S26]